MRKISAVLSQVFFFYRSDYPVNCRDKGRPVFWQDTIKPESIRSAQGRKFCGDLQSLCQRPHFPVLFRLTFLFPVSLPDFPVQFWIRIDSQHIYTDQSRVELIAHSGGGPRPTLPAPSAGYSCQIKKAVTDACSVKPFALFQNIFRKIPLIHEPQRRIIRRLHADCQPVITCPAQSCKFLIGFQGNVRHSGKAANGFRLREIAVHQLCYPHQSFIFQHKGICPGQESPGYPPAAKRTVRPLRLL